MKKSADLRIASTPTQLPAQTMQPKAVPRPDHAPENQVGAAAKPRPAIRQARLKKRHAFVLVSFLAYVVLPTAFAAYYLWERAADQYESRVGFSVRKEEVETAIDSLVGIAQLSGSSSSDTDILYEFLQSQALVQEVDQDLDLRAIWAKADVEIDPIFAYHAPGTIEDLMRHWDRMVKIEYDVATGLINLRVLSFDPTDSQAIANAIYLKSSDMINQVSSIAHEDTVRHAREELQHSETRLKAARVALLNARQRNQTIDPTLQSLSQSGLISALETQLADSQIGLALLRRSALTEGPRSDLYQRRIGAIKEQIERERAKLSVSGAATPTSVAELVGEFEALTVELEFSQEAYAAARFAYETALGEARRTSRYLAPFVTPTRAEQALHPKRSMLLGLTALFLLLSWSVFILVASTLRDRR